MSPKTDHQISKIGWIDKCVAEPERLAKFYSDLIGRGMEPCVENQEHRSYVDFTDFEDCIAKIEPGGGKTVQQGIQGNGQKFCLFNDPSGAPMMMHSISQ